MIKTSQKLTMLQAATFVTCSMLGHGALILPRTVTQKLKTPDAWFIMLSLGVIFILFGLFVTHIASKTPNKNIFDLNKEIFGKIIGVILNFYLIIYFLAIVIFEVRGLGEIIQFFLLAKTPMYMTMALFLGIAIFHVKGGTYSISKLFAFLFPFTLFIYFFLMAFSLKIFELKNLRPILEKNIISSWPAYTDAFVYFSGFEVILILIPFMQKTASAKKALTIGIALTTFFYVIATVCVLGAMTHEEVITLTWPTLSLIQSFEIQGIFIQRFDMFFLTIWIFQFFTVTTSYLNSSYIGLKSVFNQKGSKYIFLFLVSISLLSSLLPKDIDDFFSFGGILSYCYFFTLIIILLTYTVQLFINKRRGTTS
ncbi:GerAB/ArcD/ProY family transporter [Priestia megaterium]